MKKHVVALSVALLTLAPVKVFSMDGPPAQLKALQPLSQKKHSSRLWALMNKYNDLEKITDPTLLRQGIFEAQELLERAPEEQALESIYSRKEKILARLTELEGSEEAAKTFCWSVLSDDEEAEPTTRGNYVTWQRRTDNVDRLTTEIGTLDEQLAAVRAAKEQKAQQVAVLKAQLEAAEEEDRDLENQVNHTEQEYGTLQTARAVVGAKVMTAYQNMKQQHKALKAAIKVQNNQIEQLQQEREGLTVQGEIEAKDVEIAAKTKEHKDLTTALEQLKKDYWKHVKGQPGTFARLGWKLGAYSYPDLSDDEGEEARAVAAADSAGSASGDGSAQENS